MDTTQVMDMYACSCLWLVLAIDFVVSFSEKQIRKRILANSCVSWVDKNCKRNEQVQLCL